MRHGWSLAQLDQIWANDITCIRDHQDWLYLTTVIDLYSQEVVGWPMNSTMAMKLVLNATTVAVWRGRPTTPVVIYSDQGSQGAFNQSSQHLDHEDVYGATRRVDAEVDGAKSDAVAEFFFSSLRKEHIKRRICASRQEAKSDVFDYIAGLINWVPRHSHLDQLSPLAFQQLRAGS